MDTRIPVTLLLLLTALLLSCAKKKPPSLQIFVDEELSTDKKEACTVVFEHPDTLSGRIKYRGGMSVRFEKHNYALELDKKYAFPSLPPDDDWILNANYIDKTFMRHKIAYDLFRTMRAENMASQSTYVSVQVNGQYEGLYVLMQEINAKMLGLNKADTMAMLFKDPPIFSRERLPEVQDSLNYYQQKFPKLALSDKTACIEAFKDFLFHSTNEEFLRDITNWIDIDNVIDWHILLLFSNNGDGIMKNFYLYKIDNATPFRIAIWDYDHSFGRDGDNERNLLERELDCDRSVLLKRLNGIPGSDYPDQLKARWLELRESHIISYKNFKQRIRENDRRMGRELKRNFKRWPADSHWYYDDAGYSQEIDLMLEFVRQRIQQLDARFGLAESSAE